MSDPATTLLAGLLMALGLIGIVVPILPDMALMWLAALGYGLLVGWGQWGGWLFALITILAFAGVLAEVWAGSAGARAGGASFVSIAAGFALGAIGFVFLTPIGGIAGLLLGTFLAEYWRLRDSRKAIRGTLGIGVGYGLSFVMKGIIGLIILAAWLVWVYTL